MPNRLYHVNDAVATGLASNEDISDPGYSFTNGLEYANYDNNFSYNEIGNLKRNSSEGIKHIEWTIIDKVKSITRYDGFSKTVNQTTIYPSDLEFLYDATGNRIAKIEKTRDENGLKSSADWITTYYTRDAQGNIMSVYKLSSEAQQTTFAQTEVSIYGSSRVGVDNTLTELISPVPQGNIFNNILGKKQYELTNHLGNVLATVSDIKFQQDYNADNEVDSYTADIITAQDYYPFGMLMPGRTYGSNSYKFGFNGQELDNEVIGVTGSHYTAEFWEYDSRLGRRWEIDPEPKDFASPYATFSNNPIWFTDPNGRDTIVNPNGEEMNAGDGYAASDDKTVLYGEGLKTKVWDSKALGISGEYNGNYVDYAPNKHGKISNANSATATIDNALNNVERSISQGGLLQDLKNDPGFKTFEYDVLQQAMNDKRFGNSAFAFDYNNGQGKLITFGGESNTYLPMSVQAGITAVSPALSLIMFLNTWSAALLTQHG